MKIIAFIETDRNYRKDIKTSWTLACPSAAKESQKKDPRPRYIPYLVKTTLILKSHPG
jgi:hypothetical protein